jgi:hypothetical protein
LEWPESRLRSLQTCFATPQEKTRIAGFRGDVERLQRPERWLLRLNVIPHFEERVRFWLPKCRFQDTAEELEALLCRLQDANAALQNSGSFRRLLRLVLDLGNALNAGASSGCCFGFRLSALQQLQRLRSADNKRSLLEVVAAVVLNDHPQVRSFLSEFECMQLASGGIRPCPPRRLPTRDGLRCSGIGRVEKRLARLQAELQRLEQFVVSSGSGDEGDGVQSCFGAFVPAAQERARRLHEASLKTFAAVEASAVSFGEPEGGIKPEEWFGALFDFSTAYRSADEKAQRQRRLQDREDHSSQEANRKIMSTK